MTIDYFPDDQYQKYIEQLRKNPVEEKFKGEIFYPIDVWFITSDEQLINLEYKNYPLLEELGLSEEEWTRWNKYMALDRNSDEYLKVYREALIGQIVSQFKFSRLLGKRTGLTFHNMIMQQFMLELQKIDKKLGLVSKAGYV